MFNNSTKALYKDLYKVNVMTFSGHGFTYNGDAIGVIP